MRYIQQIILNGSGGDNAGDLIVMGLYGMGVGKQYHHGCANAARRPDNAEQIGALIMLVVGLVRTLWCVPTASRFISS